MATVGVAGMATIPAISGTECCNSDGGSKRRISSSVSWMSMTDAQRSRYGYAACRLKSQFLGDGILGYSAAIDSKSGSGVVVARLFGPAIFEASKLKVLFLGDGKDKHPDQLPRAYTLTHSDVTAKLTLAVSQTINKAQIQGWYSRLQRDEVLAEWKKSQGCMSLHVHCHISGGHWLLDAIANLRFYIFRKELPVVLEAFRYGDENLFKNHPGPLYTRQILITLCGPPKFREIIFIEQSFSVEEEVTTKI